MKVKHKMPPRRPKTLPRWPQDGSRRPPRHMQDTPKTPQNVLKTPSRWPKMRPRRSLHTPREPQDDPGNPKTPTKRPKTPPRRLQTSILVPRDLDFGSFWHRQTTPWTPWHWSNVFMTRPGGMREAIKLILSVLFTYFYLNGNALSWKKQGLRYIYLFFVCFFLFLCCLVLTS